MSDFETEIKETEFTSYADEETQGDGFVRIQWRQGDPKANTGGFFFLAKSAVPEDFAPTGDLWKPHNEYFEQSRTREDGWKAERLPMCIICARAQPYLRNDKGKTWLDKWPKDTLNVAMHADVLLIAEGLEVLGPVVWSTNGTKTAFAIIGRANVKHGYPGGILDRVRNDVLAPMGKIVGRDLAKQYWLFWIAIVSERDSKGFIYTETPGKLVTLPVPDLPATIDRDWLKANYSGKAMLDYGEAMRAMHDSWKTVRFTNDVQPAVTAVKNVPRAIEDDSDLPF